MEIQNILMRHTPSSQSDTPSNLEGEFLKNTDARLNTTHSTAASGTESTCHWQLDPNLGEEFKEKIWNIINFTEV